MQVDSTRYWYLTRKTDSTDIVTITSNELNSEENTNYIDIIYSVENKQLEIELKNSAYTRKFLELSQINPLVLDCFSIFTDVKLWMTITRGFNYYSINNLKMLNVLKLCRRLDKRKQSSSSNSSSSSGT